MGLENLKSAFSNIKMMNQSDVTQAENLQTLDIDSGIMPTDATELGKGELVFETLYNNDQTQLFLLPYIDNH